MDLISHRGSTRNGVGSGPSCFGVMVENVNAAARVSGWSVTM